MSAGPLREVLTAITAGAGSVAEITSVTGLREDVVRAGIGHLVRSGTLEARELSMGCPASGCGGCASGRSDGSAGCGALGPSPGRRGAALVALTPRR